MAVPVQDNLPPGVLRRLKLRSVMDQKFAEQQALVAQPLCAPILGEEVRQLIAKDAGATRLEEDKGHSGIDLRSQIAHGVLQVLTRLAQKAKVVERPTAADVLPRHVHSEAGPAQSTRRGAERLRMVVVVPG